MRHAPFLKLLFLMISLGPFFGASPAQALVRIHIDLSGQRMQVDSDRGSYSWPISTAASGYVTPRGSFAPTSLQRMHYSRKYHMSPMPYSIFFLGGYAIHGTYATAYLGRPASHGCVRLSTEHAATLFHMVQAEGAQISISGSPPRTPYYVQDGNGRRGRVAAAPAPADTGFFLFGPPQ
jgi:hypothetical protein